MKNANQSSGGRPQARAAPRHAALIKLEPRRYSPLLRQAVERDVRTALTEDLGGGDLSAALVDPGVDGEAVIVSRDDAVLAGCFWADEVFRRIDASITVAWQVADGGRISPGQTLCTITGPLAGILSGERCALNFLQMLSATATATAACVERAADTKAVILDTRKTLPGLRFAQKYAVVCGGGRNHRFGLFDGILVKDNHIRACGSIGEAVARARVRHPGRRVEVETETWDEIAAALEAGADVIMLDNFSPGEIGAAVEMIAGRAEVEVSGGVAPGDVARIAACGVDRISIGALTKHVCATDLSLQLRRTAGVHGP